MQLIQPPAGRQGPLTQDGGAAQSRRHRAVLDQRVAKRPFISSISAFWAVMMDCASSTAGL